MKVLSIDRDTGHTRERVPPPYLDARDQFAAAALTGLLAGGGNRPWEADELADQSYRIADAMLEARGL